MKKLILFALLLGSLNLRGQDLNYYLDRPIASNLATTPDGSKAAWVINARGHRNIAARIDGAVSWVTTFQDDDGQELGDLTFSADGQYILFVRGGAANGSGQHPNPASLADAPDEAIFAVKPGSPPFRIAAGSQPCAGPEPGSILYHHNGQIYKTLIQKDATGVPLFTARGGNGGALLSPDKTEVLFTSSRGDHGFVGVFNMAERKIRWIAPEVSRDVFPRWSPDGKQIVFFRMPGQKFNSPDNLIGGVQLQLWVADALSGQARMIWSSPDETEGYIQSSTSDPLAWSAAGRIVFLSEHSGWSHVYSIQPDGKDLKELTPGEGEVENFCLSKDGATVYFDGNIGDIDRRHIGSVAVAGGTPVAVTTGEGIEMSPMVAGNTLYAFQSTTIRNKSLVTIDKMGEKIHPISPASLSVPGSRAFVKPEAITFKAADGTLIHGQLFINRAVAGKRPGLVFMHGGPIRQMLLGFHYSDYYSNCYAFNQYMANQGYAVIAVNYRNGIGYGRKFRTSSDQGPRGAVEYQDIVAAGKFLQQLPEVNGEKIGLWGGSYGGYLTAMGLARNPGLFKVGVDLHGVHDWSITAKRRHTGRRDFTAADAALAKKSSPVADLSR
ncbi:MAG: prolyl oligopeptidase family serine peptidase [Cyclobacteriaceae bacterium]